MSLGGLHRSGYLSKRALLVQTFEWEVNLQGDPSGSKVETGRALDLNPLQHSVVNYQRIRHSRNESLLKGVGACSLSTFLPRYQGTTKNEEIHSHKF